MFGSIPYLPGTSPSKPEPLSRYLPPVPEGVISSWLQKNVTQGSWILDPFGASPRIALEAARTGYRALVTANNPITRFLLEMMADPPQAEELKSALAELAASFVGNERTEPHIRHLYNTYCARCGQSVSADYFIWEQGNPSPSTRSYTCPNCGDSGEHPCSLYDVELSSKFSGSGLHKARALERVVASTDQDRIHVEQALSVYIPRALYALITIINKIEGLNISTRGRKNIYALLLYAFDRANAMWRVPPQKERRRQLTIPRHFRENNVWLALEEGINLWSKGDKDNSATIPVTTWPEVPPPTGGICIYEGRFIALAESIKNIDIESVCTALPRPNQAFWTLSALWAGWLWGREAVGSFKSVLRRQRYDWAWHTTALTSVFKQLVNSLKPDTAILGIISETEPGFIGAALVAASLAGCHLAGLSLRCEIDQAQIIWRSQPNSELIRTTPLQSQIAIESARRYLEERAEPASYLNTITSALMGILTSWNTQIDKQSDTEKNFTANLPSSTQPKEQTEPTPSLIYSSIYNSAREVLSYRSGFLRYNLQEISNVEAENKNQIIQSTLFSLDLPQNTPGDDEAENTEISSSGNEPASGKERPPRSSDISESTYLWLRETKDRNHTPITDSYELNLINFLINHPGCTSQEVDLALCDMFPGLFTPDLEFIHLCLESYATPDPHDVNRWFVRPEDYLSERKSDVERAHQFIDQIGRHLGFLCTAHIDRSSRTYITWQDKSNDQVYSFYPVVSAAIGEIVLYSEQQPSRGFIVLPGSRANLLFYKLRRDPRISKAFNPSTGNWKFLKFRHLRSLAESPILNRENLDQLLELDPITYSTPQIWLI
jgi:hypothetical protein